MLRFLSIRHLAVIDAVEVEFGPGFNVLTGETGAGKSMLVGAVDLLLGGRASADLVRTGEEAASIEAVFEHGPTETIVRREITSQGRSRAFVDGVLVTAAALKELSPNLIEIHGQHEHHTLLDPATHLAVLDTFAGLDALAGPVAASFNRLRVASEALARTRQAASERESRRDFVAFQLSELQRASLAGGDEDDELAATRQVLANAERVERLCAESYAALYDSDASVLATLGGVWRRVGELAVLDPRFSGYLDARDAIKSQLEDLAAFLRRYAETVDASPERLHAVEERLALLERLKRKYGPALPDVLARRDALAGELEDLEGGAQRIEELERDTAAARAAFLTDAGALTAARAAAAVDFAARLETLLAELAMEGTRFEARFAAEPLPEAAWTVRGVDQVEFFVSPNPGEALRPLARVVSGGELSRIMLAIKTLSFRERLAVAGRRPRAQGTGAPGLIFDEVDAGIGGRVADVVGRRLRGLGAAFQVLCITHLPQIAACADTHFQIEKRVAGGRTLTSVRRLDDGGRVEELGRMLGGAGVSETVLASAREMLDRRDGPPHAPIARGAKAKGERRKLR
jgi:DNA repair protein RecN (Recombination protein N)